MKDIDEKLYTLQYADGRERIDLLREIIAHRSLKPITDEDCILTGIWSGSPDYPALLSCARKAVQHGYKVAILPNPKGFRTPDLILYNEKFIAAYDVKTILGQSSVGNRLSESIGQTKRVILNMATGYNARSLAKDIKGYFEANKEAVEVIIFKGKASTAGNVSGERKRKSLNQS